MNLISFDLEIAKEIPESCIDWKAQAPFGISCAAHWDGMINIEFFDHPQLTKDRANIMVDWMLAYAENGKRFLTWNGCSFDFWVLGYESGRWQDCAKLCMEHVDMMLIATINKGWYVGLNSALAGHGIESKQHRVRLSSGEFIDDMNGSKAPTLWKAGETEAVLTYLRGDVERPLLLAQSIMKEKQLRFISKKGMMHIVDVPKLWTVKEMMSQSMADNRWMDNPPTKRKFVEWMFPYVEGLEDFLGESANDSTM